MTRSRRGAADRRRVKSFFARFSCLFSKFSHVHHVTIAEPFFFFLLSMLTTMSLQSLPPLAQMNSQFSFTLLEGCKRREALSPL